jgi:copper chaperone CopZ
MRYLQAAFIFILSINSLQVSANQEEHLHKKKSNGATIQIDQSRLNNFSEGLSQAKIIVVSVNGMVCDFCARGIEKIFKRDADLIKINVDLNIGKVLIAYKQTKEIDEKEIRMAIQNSGQEVVKIDILQ